MTATAVARPEARELTPGKLTPDQVALIKRQLMSAKREPTDDELALFVHQAERTGLDPFARQIYAIFRWDSRAGDEKMTVQASIDGLRLVADRTRAYAPGSTFWCGKDGVWRDVWLEKESPVAARVAVRKLVGGQLVEFAVPALWTEYAPYNQQGKLGGLWPKMPALMLAKCSEALGLRRGFPNETSGLYIAEEMDQADVGRDDALVGQLKQTFNATEAPPNVDRQTGEVIDAQPSPPPAEAAASPNDDAVVNPDDPIDASEVEKLRDFLQTRLDMPDVFLQMGLMKLNLDRPDQLTKAQAHELMVEAKGRPEKHG